MRAELQLFLEGLALSGLRAGKLMPTGVVGTTEIFVVSSDEGLGAVSWEMVVAVQPRDTEKESPARGWKKPQGPSTPPLQRAHLSWVRL